MFKYLSSIIKDSDMDYKHSLNQLIAGSKSQRKRKEQLDKEKKERLTHYTKNKSEENKQKLQNTIDSQLRFCTKINEGVKNSLRSLNIRLFVLLFQHKEYYAVLYSVEKLLKEFNGWIAQYETIIQEKDLKKEEQHNKAIFSLLQRFEQKKKEIEFIMKKETLLKHKSMLLFGILLLTFVILLFRETKIIVFDEEIFSKKNRYNPLNPFFPF